MFLPPPSALPAHLPPNPLTPAQGKSPRRQKGLMRPRNDAHFHEAAEMLLRYAYDGCPVDCGRNWTVPEMQAAIDRGAHPSAQKPEAAAACRAEALERVKDGCCRIVKWNDIRHNPPPNLKISPIAAIPHKSRLYRMILDLAFSLKMPTHAIPSVNDSSDKTLAPQHAMYELGNVIPRIVHALATAPDDGIPFLFSKIDLKDGYWRMVVNERDAWNFAYVLPPLHPTDEPQLVIPDSLQMGWSESPPFFCAATETARDIAATSLSATKPLHHHPLEHIMLSGHDTDDDTTEHRKFLTLLEVYVDDFIALAHTTNPRELQRISRALLHAIEAIFPGPEVTGSSMGPAVSTKKLIAEGTWESKKEILGWLIDGMARTISLPPEKAAKLITNAKHMSNLRAIPLKQFHQTHGKLQFASIAIPCGKALMGPLDKAIAKATKTEKRFIPVTAQLRDTLRDWTALLRHAAARPTHVKELVEHTPTFRGFVDASKWGVGGVWFGGTLPLQPTVWFTPWPDTIRTQLCTDKNRHGTITISDLELAGILFHFLALESIATKQGYSLKHQSVAIWCDNLPAVAWTYKFRTATSDVSARLLRALAVRLHATHSALINIQHISGSYNIMADVASRQHTTDPSAFLHSFSTTFPPPQQGYWTLFQFANTLKSKVFSELLHERSPLESWKRLKEHGGAFGTNGANGFISTSLHSLQRLQACTQPCSTTCWLPTPSMCEQAAFEPPNRKFEPKLSKWRYAPSPRQSSWMVNEIPWKRRKAAIQNSSTNSWRATKEKIHRRNHD